MRTHPRLSLLVCSLVLVTGATVHAANSDQANSSSAPSKASTAPTKEPAAEAPSSAQAETSEAPKKQVKNPHGWPVLKKGMPAEEITKAIGKPDTIKPMDTPEGKAEVWIYRRLANSVTRQTAATTESIAAYNGIGVGNDSIGTTVVPSYRMEHVDVYQVSSLLMFQGKFVAASQKVEQESHFE